MRTALGGGARLAWGRVHRYAGACLLLSVLLLPALSGYSLDSVRWFRRMKR
jgi:hypothetical protein